MNSNEKIGVLQSLWNSFKGVKDEVKQDEVKVEAAKEVVETKLAEDVVNDVVKEDVKEEVKVPDMNAKMDEILAALKVLTEKLGAGEVKMSKMEEVVGKIVETTVAMNSEVVEMKNIPQGEIAGKTVKVEVAKADKTEEYTALYPKSKAFQNLQERMKASTNN